MTASKKDSVVQKRSIAQNRKARHDYFIEDSFEAGIVLTGTEVKSLRIGKASITESYASVEGNEIYLINAHVPVYEPAHRRFNHDPRRHRKLLLSRRQIDKLTGALQNKGTTLIPLELYFNERGIAKLNLGLATGKKQHDKRQSEKDRDWQRQKARIMKAYS